MCQRFPGTYVIHCFVFAVDLIPPDIVGCPTSDVFVEVPFNTPSSIVTWGPITATDNTGAQPTLQQTHNSGGTFSVGITPVTYTFTDPSGNSAVCRFNVVVQQRGKQISTSGAGQALKGTVYSTFFVYLNGQVIKVEDSSAMMLNQSSQN